MVGKYSLSTKSTILSVITELCIIFVSHSNDAFGLYSGFEGSLAVVNEPRRDELNTYMLTMQRTHGTFGVVEVSWFASITGNV